MNGINLGYVAIDAVAHMIGQTETMFNRGATIAEIAAWLKVSKPTAKRFIDNQLQDIVCKDVVTWREGHSVAFRYRLNEYKRSAFQRDLFYSSYKVYANSILKGYL